MLVESTDTQRGQPGRLRLAGGGVHPYRGEHRRVGAVLRPAAVSFPHGLPRPELLRQIPPWRPGPKPPRNAFQGAPVIVPRPSATARPAGQDRLDHRPQLIRDHTRRAARRRSSTTQRSRLSRHALGTNSMVCSFPRGARPACTASRPTGGRAVEQPNLFDRHPPIVPADGPAWLLRTQESFRPLARPPEGDLSGPHATRQSIRCKEGGRMPRTGALVPVQRLRVQLSAVTGR